MIGLPVDAFIQKYDLAKVITFAEERARQLFGAVDVSQTLQQREKSESYLRLRIHVRDQVPQFFNKRQEFIDSIWNEFPELDRELLFVSVRYAKDNG